MEFEAMKLRARTGTIFPEESDVDTNSNTH
jgi:hypothetical protein